MKTKSYCTILLLSLISFSCGDINKTSTVPVSKQIPVQDPSPIASQYSNQLTLAEAETMGDLRALSESDSYFYQMVFPKNSNLKIQKDQKLFRFQRYDMVCDFVILINAKETIDLSGLSVTIHKASHSTVLFDDEDDIYTDRLYCNQSRDMSVVDLIELLDQYGVKLIKVNTQTQDPNQLTGAQAKTMGDLSALKKNDNYFYRIVFPQNSNFKMEKGQDTFRVRRYDMVCDFVRLSKVEKTIDLSNRSISINEASPTTLMFVSSGVDEKYFHSLYCNHYRKTSVVDLILMLNRYGIKIMSVKNSTQDE